MKKGEQASNAVAMTCLYLSDFRLQVVLSERAISCLESLGHGSQPGLPAIVHEKLAHANARARRFGGIAGANALPGGPDELCTQFTLRQAVDDAMQVKDYVGPIGNEDPTPGADSLPIDLVELFEEIAWAESNARTDEVDTSRSRNPW